MDADRVTPPIGAQTSWLTAIPVVIGGLLWTLAFPAGQVVEASEGGAGFRRTLPALAAATAALSAVIALRPSLLRTYFRRRTAEAEEDSFLADRNAVAGLGAEKQVNRLGRTGTFDGEKRSEFEGRGGSPRGRNALPGMGGTPGGSRSATASPTT